jgi:hypothetical protein
VPIIAVFTKYDLMVESQERNLDDSACEELDDEGITTLAEEEANKAIERICIAPLKERRIDLPNIVVSGMFIHSGSSRLSYRI